MNYNNIKHGEQINYDMIVNLPIDKIEPSGSELILLNKLFKDKEHKSVINTIIEEAYEPLFVGILFFVLSIPKLDELITSKIAITKDSIYFLILFKMVIIMISFWVIKHFHLCRK